VRSEIDEWEPLIQAAGVVREFTRTQATFEFNGVEAISKAIRKLIEDRRSRRTSCP
jgi:hypothetical protein